MRFPATIPPLFAPEYRASGVLLHVTSLPSPYGIGDVGPGAVAWLQRLHEAGQVWWQALPLGPTGYGDSPYQSFSSFAGNGLLASPEWLICDGLLVPEDCQERFSAEKPVDYGKVLKFKLGLLDKAWAGFQRGASEELRWGFEEFCIYHAAWLDDYALFRALKETYHNKHYLSWPAELVGRDPGALAQARQKLASRIDQVRFAQFVLFQQGARLKERARAWGVRLIGDLPFFVSPDSSDVWAHPEFFQLDEHYRPRFVAGVPPDAFSATGQLWGNPVYDWEELGRSGYRWWIERIRSLLAHVDAVRLDHFRAFAAAWHVPAGAPTAETGLCTPGPGAELFQVIAESLYGLPFIVEDLGLITPDVCSLRDQFALAGTRVLQFGFDQNPANPHLPSNCPHNAVLYTGTHDNPTTRAWLEALPEGQREQVRKYLGERGAGNNEIVWELIRAAWSSEAALTIVPLQDLLNLGDEARMNTPGTAQGNWGWRCTDQMLHGFSCHALRELTMGSHREVPLASSALRQANLTTLRSGSATAVDQGSLSV